VTDPTRAPRIACSTVSLIPTPLHDVFPFEHVVLDTSHAAVAGLHLLETLDRLRTRLAHVHLSNNAGKGWDSHLPVSEGVLALESFLDALAGTGFACSASLEIDLRRHLGDPEAPLRVLAANRAFCAERLPLAV
jgi:sugar phosphate isomerase/epimerase